MMLLFLFQICASQELDQEMIEILKILQYMDNPNSTISADDYMELLELEKNWLGHEINEYLVNKDLLSWEEWSYEISRKIAEIDQAEIEYQKNLTDLSLYNLRRLSAELHIAKEMSEYEYERMNAAAHGIRGYRGMSPLLLPPAVSPPYGSGRVELPEPSPIFDPEMIEKIRTLQKMDDAKYSSVEEDDRAYDELLILEKTYLKNEITQYLIGKDAFDARAWNNEVDNKSQELENARELYSKNPTESNLYSLRVISAEYHAAQQMEEAEFDATHPKKSSLDTSRLSERSANEVNKTANHSKLNQSLDLPTPNFSRPVTPR